MVLARQWDKAVRYVAASDRQIGDDPTFGRRADQIATHVHRVQARAAAADGRWTTYASCHDATRARLRAALRTN